MKFAHRILFLSLLAVIFFYFLFRRSRAPYFHRGLLRNGNIKPSDPDFPGSPWPADVFLRSAYYYPTSKSLGDNSIALVLVANYDFVYYAEEIPIRAWNKTTAVKQIAKLQITTPWKISKCKWTTIFATAPTLPGMTHLELDLGGAYYEIPFETVSYEKKDFVICTSPLFANEQWQFVAFAAHLYKRYGAFMHVYVRSAVEPIYNLLKMYQKEGYLKVEPWSRLKLSSIPDRLFEPNKHVEFRNQDAAQTDCLLRYKESARFITFLDLDDILMPRNKTSFLEEFESFIQGVDYIHYVKENVHVEASNSSASFSMNDIFHTSRFENFEETGKYVTRPEFVNHTMIHYPGEDEKRYKGYFVQKRDNVIVHLKKLSPLGEDLMERKFHPYIFGNGEIFDEEDSIAIEQDFQRIRKKYAHIWAKQPQEAYYLKKIVDCYNKKYYNFWYGGHSEKITYCANPDMCELPPKPGIYCSNARAFFHSSENGSVFNIHYGTKKQFLTENGCIV